MRLLPAIAATLLLQALPAAAQDFGSRFCSTVACAGAGAEQAAVAPTWSSLKAMGTDQMIGATFSGVTVDAAAMVAGARVIGPIEMDRVMRGGAMDPGLASVVRSAMSSVQGADISSVTGKVSTMRAGFDLSSIASAAASAAGGGDAGRAATSVIGALTGSGGSSGSSGTSSMNSSGDSPPGCDSSVSQKMVESSSKYVEDMDQIARSDMGFTRKDGKGAQSSYESEVGNKKPFQGSGSMGGLSCLSNLFQKSNVLDSLFRPPTMQSLMNQVQNMTCGPALAAIGGANQSMNRSIFSTASMGGFFPGMFMTALGGALNGGSGSSSGIGGFSTSSLASISGGSGSYFGGSSGGSGSSNGGYAALFGSR